MFSLPFFVHIRGGGAYSQMVNNPLNIQDLFYLFVYPPKYMNSFRFFVHIRFSDRVIRIFITKGLGVPGEGNPLILYYFPRGSPLKF